MLGYQTTPLASATAAAASQRRVRGCHQTCRSWTPV